MKISQPSRLVLPPRRKCRQSQPSAPIAPPFGIGYSERRPLVPLSAARAFLNRDSREIIALIEEGRLPWAFNIGSRTAARREVRVLWQSLLEFTALWPRLRPENRTEAAEFERVTQLILPPGTVAPNQIAHQPITQPALARETLLETSDVARCFSCRTDHILYLIREHSLQTFDVRQGLKSPSQIRRASVVAFLQERRIS